MAGYFRNRWQDKTGMGGRFHQNTQGTAENTNIPGKIGNDIDWLNIFAGGYHTLGIKTDGTLWAWGFNSYGQLGDGTAWRDTPMKIDY